MKIVAVWAVRIAIPDVTKQWILLAFEGGVSHSGGVRPIKPKTVWVI